MAKPPVLKPREVVALLGKLGFAEVRSEALTASFDMPTVARRQYRFIRTAIFRRRCFVTSRRTSANGADIAPETLYEAALATRSNPALQPTAGEGDVPEKPSKPGRW